VPTFEHAKDLEQLEIGRVGERVVLFGTVVGHDRTAPSKSSKISPAIELNPLK
jgi:hypothetical protein